MLNAVVASEDGTVLVEDVAELKESAGGGPLIFDREEGIDKDIAVSDNVEGGLKRLEVNSVGLQHGRRRDALGDESARRHLEETVDARVIGDGVDR